MNSSNKPRFAFLGTPRFALFVLDELEKASLLPSLVITAKDKPTGRNQISAPSPVHTWAAKRNIAIKFADTKKEVEDALSSSELDVAVTAAFNVILTARALSLPTHGVLNVHPSLLPEYRGPSPIQSALLAQDKETGCCVFVLDEKVDHGPILACERFCISDENYLQLEEALGRRGGSLLARVLAPYIAGEIIPQEQEHERASYTKKFEIDDGRLDLSNTDSAALLARVRALNPEPGAYAVIKTRRGERRVKILDAIVTGGQFNPIRVIPEGKHEMSWDAFTRGNL
ncbi:MAG: methionyl-tRNA formyltransferase [Candidatus Vogelbacteria bacterium]|nr:methionyl-tRNA formyltransferase [Candidatus Vogelbacteria bacterium]